MLLNMTQRRLIQIEKVTFIIIQRVYLIYQSTLRKLNPQAVACKIVAINLVCMQILHKHIRTCMYVLMSRIFSYTQFWGYLSVNM